MSSPDRSTPPPENSKSGSSPGHSDAWVMKGLNDLRDDMKGLKLTIESMNGRLVSIETKVLRAVYVSSGVMMTIFTIWAIFQIITKYVDIKVSPKESVTQEVEPKAP